MATLAKMTEMANNRQIVNNISNEMAKGLFLKVASWGKMAYLTKYSNNGFVDIQIVDLYDSAKGSL